MTTAAVSASRRARALPISIPWFLIALVLAAVLPPLIGRTALLSDKNALLLTAGCATALAALSLNVLMGYAGQLSLGQFAFVGVGAFTTGIVTGVNDLRMPWLVGLVASAVLGGVVAFVVGLPALRLRGLYLAVVTIGVAYVAWQSLFRVDQIGGGSAGKVVPSPYIGSTPISRNCDVLALAAVVLVFAWRADVNIARSRIGRAFHALKSDEQVAASFGIDVAQYKLLAFTISGALAGIGGCIFGTAFGTITGDTFMWSRSLALVVVVVIGGLGSRPGVVVAAILMTLMPETMVWIFGEGIRGYDQVILAALLVYTVARHPGGFAGAIAHANEKRARKKGGAPPLPPTRPELPALKRPPGLPTPRKTRPGQAVLQVNDVDVRFGGLRAVDGASLRVDRGTIVGLMGPNGAGKTTLFNVVTGALRPDAGSVEFLGENVSGLPAHQRAARGMGRTFQLIGLAKDQSVYENLLMAQHLAAPYSVASAITGIGASRWYERDLRARADEVIEGLGFQRYRDTAINRLSHGQQRIVEIGCCLVTSPELVMLDEPSAGMSPAAAEDLAATLLDVRDVLHRTVLLIEHNVPLVLATADELYVMAAGRVIANGEPIEVVARPEVVSAYLGVAPQSEGVLA